MEKKIIFIAIISLIILSIFISGCGSITVQQLNENKDKYFGKEVSVNGIAENTMKIGTISGFTLKSEDGIDQIAVKSDVLPNEGDKITVRGILMKELMFYYLYADKIN